MSACSHFQTFPRDQIPEELSSWARVVMVPADLNGLAINKVFGRKECGDLLKKPRPGRFVL